MDDEDYLGEETQDPDDDEQVSDYDAALFDDEVPEKLDQRGVPRDFKFVHITNQDGDELIRIETMENRDVPIGYSFLGLRDDDPKKMETLAAAPEIPLDFRLTQHEIANEGEEMKMEEN